MFSFFPLPVKRGEGAERLSPEAGVGLCWANVHEPLTRLGPSVLATLSASLGEGKQPHTIVGTGLNVVR
jgi:hypothetical protein